MGSENLSVSTRPWSGWGQVWEGGVAESWSIRIERCFVSVETDCKIWEVVSSVELGWQLPWKVRARWRVCLFVLMQDMR